MNNRERALETIRIKYAKYGKETQESMRAYVENRISGGARNKVVRAGLLAYQLNKKVLSVWNDNGEGSGEK